MKTTFGRLAIGEKFRFVGESTVNTKETPMMYRPDVEGGKRKSTNKPEIVEKVAK